MKRMLVYMFTILGVTQSLKIDEEKVEILEPECPSILTFNGDLRNSKKGERMWVWEIGVLH